MEQVATGAACCGAGIGVQTDVAGDVGCDAPEEKRRAACAAGASSEETDCTESALSEDGAVPSQCLVERCSSAVCFCAQGLPLGKGTGQRWDLGQLGSVQRPRAPLMPVSTPLTFLCQDLSKALAAGTCFAPADGAVDLALAFGRPGTAARPDLVRLRRGFPTAGGGAADGSAGAARGLGTCATRGRGCRADGI